VDTPEEYDPDVPVECFAAAAKAYTASLIPVGTLIYLDKDVTDYDRYGRRLRNIWFLDAAGNYRLLQDSLVRNGYAVISTFPPDVKYVTFLADAQRHAQASGRGLWSACGGPDVPDGSPPPTPTPSLTDSNACDPAYPEVCIPPVSQSGDLDCRDIPYHWFVVLKPDPHNFDVDGDGFGCQS
ncbi:MAG: thermonuclease family protein, partial [Thermomicrobiales bacterium]